MPAPLTPNQERLWFLHRLDPSSVSYSLPWQLVLRGDLDVEALAKALSVILERHPPLRCRILEIDGEPRMVPQPIEPVDLHQTDIDDPATLDDAVRAEIARPLDLTDGPILRFKLFRLAADHHVLVWAVHHIVYDLSSYNVMLDELERLFQASTIDAAALDPLPIAYGDYTRRIRERAEAGESEAALTHWRNALSGFEPLELPVDRPRPTRPNRPASIAIRKVSGELTEALRVLARERGRSTVFAPTLAAFYLLLRGLSGQDDLVLGVPIAGRDEPDVRPLVGFFVDVLALRVDLSDDPSFDTLIDRAQQLFLDARRFPQPPLDLLANELSESRRAGENPFFPATFQLAREPRAPELPGLEITQSRLRADNVKFDIRMDVYDRRDHLSLEIEYDTEILDATTIERWFDVYVGLLDAAITDPSRPISELPLATPGDRAIIDRANDNASTIPGDVALIDQVRRHAATTPEKTAIVHGDRRWTWAALDAKAAALTAALVDAGVRPGDFVGLCVDRGAELPLGMLGILGAGGAYVSLDPDYPDDRLRFMIDDAGLSVLVVQRDLADRLPAVDGVTLVEIDDVVTTAPPRDRGREAAGSDEHGRSLSERSELWSPSTVETAAGNHSIALDSIALDGDFPGCLIYTSGSTGVPKASVLPQRGITRLVVGTNYLTFTADDIFTQTGSPSFDAATFEVWGALLNGGTLVLIDRDDLLSPTTFGETLRREGVTVVFLTTAYFQQVARQAPEAFATPRAIFFGGERCEPDAVRRALDACRAHGTRLFHAYGPSECTTYGSCGEVVDVPAGATSVPIGGPVANTTARVVDPFGRELPIGVAGELWLGGPGLAHAYHDRPRLTAEKFVPDPFGVVPGARLYRTGDRVRWLTDGSFDFLGRVDHQVKLRGFRVEPGEIEALLERLPTVDDALVMVREDLPGDRRLIGYVTPSDVESPPRGADLRAAVGGDMPAYMVPSAVIVLDRFLLTTNGKVDRRALPAPEGLSDAGVAFRPPETETEQVLAELWSEALGTDAVGLDDDFFALGGHSLIAVRLISRLRERLGVELPVRDIFERSRLIDLADAVDAARTAGPIEDDDDPVLVTAIAEARRRGVLSFGQRRLWFLAQLEPDSTAYNMPLTVELHGAVDRQALDAALTEIVRRHEVLRTRFVDDGAGEPRAVIDPPTPITLHAEAVATSEALDATLADEAATPFDLGREVLRLRYFEPTDGTTDGGVPVLLFHIHHIAFDGWSFGLLRRELKTLVDALSITPTTDPATVLPPLATTFAEHAARRAVTLSGQRLDDAIEPWRDRLAGLEPLELPADRPRPTVDGEPAATWRGALPPALARSLRQTVGANGRTLFTTLLAGFTATLHALT
ncbi:MAG: amino acid adenylation domain-containing protein, partial [Acidobacteriota bacterium]